MGGSRRLVCGSGMESLIVTCLCDAATHLRHAGLDALQLLAALLAAGD